MQAGLPPFAWAAYEQPADLQSKKLLLPPHPRVRCSSCMHAAPSCLNKPQSRWILNEYVIKGA
jgi:hypothetical protein